MFSLRILTNMIKTKKIKQVLIHNVCSCLSLVNVLFMFFASQNTRNQKQNIVFGLRMHFCWNIEKSCFKMFKIASIFFKYFHIDSKMSHVACKTIVSNVFCVETINDSSVCNVCHGVMQSSRPLPATSMLDFDSPPSSFKL